jgi:2-polyprenyl-3-methyl-5-hydroxy-6-metoxy-1,4-benzoquinol methylase
VRLPILSVGRRVRLRHTRRTVEDVLRPADRILDAGCSDGRLAVGLARSHADCNVVAVDIDDESLSTARAAAAGLENLAVERRTIGDGTPSPEFDVVVCSDVLEHVADPAAAFRWLGGCLRSGGTLVVHVPADSQQHPIGSVGAALEAEVASGKGPHLRMGFTPDQLRELAADAGLQSADVRWTFHRGGARLAADLDTWTYLRGLRLVKLVLLPWLLALAAFERSPSRSTHGNGLLLRARAAS